MIMFSKERERTEEKREERERGRALQKPFAYSRNFLGFYISPLLLLLQTFSLSLLMFSKQLSFLSGFFYDSRRRQNSKNTGENMLQQHFPQVKEDVPIGTMDHSRGKSSDVFQFRHHLGCHSSGSGCRTGLSVQAFRCHDRHR